MDRSASRTAVMFITSHTLMFYSPKLEPSMPLSSFTRVSMLPARSWGSIIGGSLFRCLISGVAERLGRWSCLDKLKEGFRLCIEGL